MNKSIVQEKETLDDLSKLPKYQLLEMLDRQKKLLSNKAALQKLADNGAKIMQTKRKIESELESRLSANQLCHAMDGLNLSTPQINALEWTTSVNELKIKTHSQEINNADDNPLKILATHSGTTYSKNVIRQEQSEESLVTEKDIEEVYVIKLCDKMNKIETPTKFLPHRTLNHTYCNKNKSPQQLKSKELCSAYEPSSKFGSAKSISLETSMKLQYVQAKKLKEVQIKQAEERLKDKAYIIGDVLPSQENVKNYRERIDSGNSNDDDDEEEEEFHEVEDDCVVEDNEGIVTYHVTD